MNSCLVLNKDLTTNLNRNWPNLFSNCSDDRSLCSANTNLPNMTYGISSGTAYFFTIGAISNQLTDIYLPQGYVCNWTFTTDPKLRYQLSIRRYDRVIQREQILLKLKSARSQDVLNDDFLWNFGASVANFRINYPKDMQIYVRNQYSTWNRTMAITIQSEPTDIDSTSVFGIVSLILFILMFSFICICIGAIIRMCIRKRQLEEQIENN